MHAPAYSACSAGGISGHLPGAAEPAEVSYENGCPPAEPAGSTLALALDDRCLIVRLTPLQRPGGTEIRMLAFAPGTRTTSSHLTAPKLPQRGR